MTPQDNWQKKKGIKVKGFKLSEKLIQEYEETCRRVGINDTAQVRKMMQEFIEQNKIT